MISYSEAGIEQIKAEAFEAGRADIEALIKNPDAVYVNYLRGSIDASSIIKAEVAHQVEAARAEERKRAAGIAREYIFSIPLTQAQRAYNNAIEDIISANLSDDKAER